MTETTVGLDLMRKPFEKHQISKLPKPTTEQTNEVKSDYKKGCRCKECGGWHHPKAVHLDYVGHAALTNRLLECDILWNWKPLSVDSNGLPLFSNAGMWIELTVCGVTRLGYGDASGKSGPDAIKEVIGDALRNAAMRFGAALDLWHKGDLHDQTNPQEDEIKNQPNPLPTPERVKLSDNSQEQIKRMLDAANWPIDQFCNATNTPSLSAIYDDQFEAVIKTIDDYRAKGPD